MEEKLEERSRTHELVSPILIATFGIISILTVPSEYRLYAVLVSIIATLTIIAYIFAASKKTHKIRGAVKRRWYKIFWQKFLEIDHVMVELLILLYDKKFSPFSFELARDAYLSFKNKTLDIEFNSNPKPRYAPLASYDEIRKLAVNKKMWNSVIYRLETMEGTESGLKLVFGPGCYLDYIATCEQIGNETYNTIMRFPFLLFRRRLHLISEKKLISKYENICNISCESFYQDELLIKAEINLFIQEVK